MFYVYICVPEYVYVHHMHAGIQGRQKRAPEPPRLVVTDSFEPLHGRWEPNSGPLQKQPVLTTAEPSL